MAPNPLTDQEKALVWALTCALSHFSTQRKYSDAELRRCVVILNRFKGDARHDGDGATVIDLNDYLRARHVRSTDVGDDDGDGRD